MNQPMAGNPVWVFTFSAQVKFRDYDTGIKGLMNIDEGTRVHIIGCNPAPGAKDWDFYLHNGGDGAILYDVPLDAINHESGSWDRQVKITEVNA